MEDFQAAHGRSSRCSDVKKKKKKNRSKISAGLGGAIGRQVASVEKFLADTRKPDQRSRCLSIIPYLIL